MDNRLYILEKVKFNTEIIKVLALTVLAAISGEITLIYQWNAFTGKNFILSFFGLLVTFVIIWMIVKLYRNNDSLIEKMK